ncbi:TPA: DUF551 domain-containing protein [Burkholderia multivorans]|nr:DUF551 domain-containing protein [Burkholderia multivorans]HDR9840790.1 DUF551 domain-containing protein [Burkholderia multivorans]HDR9847312.1 DUF551 domain-containing protein [Burkholderia multivorans]HDR9853725.1 DUF551 domain-containing protein [Burkholderia multivorans]
MTSKLTERQRMDLLLVADDMSVSGDAELADALRALLAPTQQPHHWSSPCSTCSTPRACQYDGCRQHALTAQRPSGEATGWQPIETAPKDGTNVLLIATRHSMHIPHPEMIVGAYRRGWWSGPSTLSHVTHWMPLPDAPGAAARAQGGES